MPQLLETIINKSGLLLEKKLKNKQELLEKTNLETLAPAGSVH